MHVDRSPRNCLQEVVNRIDLRLAPYDLQRRRHQPSSGSLIRSYSDYLIALAREAGADAVVSGDNDLLGLRAKGVISPRPPRPSWRRTSSARRRIVLWDERGRTARWGSTSMPARTTKGPDYRGLFEERMMGLEPTTFCMASRRSSQLSYIRGNRQSTGR